MHRAAEGPITFFEFPDAVNDHVPPGTVPIGILLKFVVVQDIRETYRLLYSVAHYPHVTWIEWFIKKYFDNELIFLGWPGRNVVLITPDMLSKIDNELMPITGFGVLATKTFRRRFNVENFIIEYLMRNIMLTDKTGESREFNPEIDAYFIETTELEHSAIPVNSNITNLKQNGRHENNVYSASEGAVLSDGSIIIDSSSGHFQPTNKQVIDVMMPLLISKGYTNLTVLLPPPDKPNYRIYITNAKLPRRSPKEGVYDKRQYLAARGLLSSVSYMGNMDDPAITKQIDRASATLPEDFW